MNRYYWGVVGGLRAGLGGLALSAVASLPGLGARLQGRQVKRVKSSAISMTPVTDQGSLALTSHKRCLYPSWSKHHLEANMGWPPTAH